MQNNDLRFLLKDKYNFKEKEIDSFLEDFNKSKQTANTDIQNDIEQLTAGCPLAYVIGYVDFLDCRIELNKNTLIPRPETEYWVEQAIEEIKKTIVLGKKEQIEILDIFCGSGCIGIALMKAFPQANVDFADISQDCLDQAKRNVILNGLDAMNLSQFIHSDVFDNQNNFKKYDYIFANPPYVSRDAEVGDNISYEPPNAIFAEENGLAIIQRFLLEAKSFLNPNGIIWMEFGIDQGNKIMLTAKKYGYTSCDIFKDQFGVKRYVRIKKPSFTRGP